MACFVSGFTSFAFSQKLASNSGISDVSIADSGIFSNYSSRLREIVIFKVPKTVYTKRVYL